MADPLPSFPVDDITLDAIEHALGGALTYERPDHALSDSDDEGPWLVGADYSLGTLLDFLAGCTGRDPNEVLVRPGDPDLPGWEGAEIVEDTRPHYSERDLIRALITEVRRLRYSPASTPGEAQRTVEFTDQSEEVDSSGEARAPRTPAAAAEQGPDGTPRRPDMASGRPLGSHLPTRYEPCVTDANGACTRWSHDHSSEIGSSPGDPS